MIRLILHNGETWEAQDSVFDLTPLGVKREDRNDAGIKTGEWVLLPWASIKEVQRFKNPPRQHAEIPSADLRSAS